MRKDVIVKERMPAHLFYGDSFLASEALQDLRETIGFDESFDANYHRMPSSELSLDRLISFCDAVPFLADNRLVVIDGLFSMFEASFGRNRRRTSSSRSTTARSSWDGLSNYLERLPPSTILVFLDGQLKKTNPLLKNVEDRIQIREFSPLSRESLSRWIRSRIDTKGSKITPSAITLLVDMIGNNLWSLDTELEKLSLYCGDRSVEESDVQLLVTQIRQANVFVAVDALLDGKIEVVLPIVRKLREDGDSLFDIIRMIVRQTRFVVLARDMLGRGVKGQQIGVSLGIGPDFAVKRTLAQAKRHTYQNLCVLYHRLLDSELTVKSGECDEALALDLLVGGSHRQASSSEMRRV